MEYFKITLKPCTGTLATEPVTSSPRSRQPPRSSADLEKIDDLESKAKALATELYEKEKRIVDQNVTLRENDSLIRSYAKKNNDLKRKLQEPPTQLQGQGRLHAKIKFATKWLQE